MLDLPALLRRPTPAELVSVADAGWVDLSVSEVAGEDAYVDAPLPPERRGLALACYSEVAGSGPVPAEVANGAIRSALAWPISLATAGSSWASRPRYYATIWLT